MIANKPRYQRLLITSIYSHVQNILCCKNWKGLLYFVNCDLHIHIMLRVLPSSLSGFNHYPCPIYLRGTYPHDCIEHCIYSKVKQTGSSENVGFSYWSKGLFPPSAPLLFDLYSLPCSCLNKIPLAAGIYTHRVVHSWTRKIDHCLHIISSSKWLTDWLANRLIGYLATWLIDRATANWIMIA